MNRIDRVINYLDKYIYKENQRKLRYIFLMHMLGVSQFASMIALKRNLNSEIASIAGLLHDIHTLETLDSTKHAYKGSLLAREILDELNMTSKEETDIICNAIFNHSNKAGTHDKYDEVLKDADVLQHCLYNTTILPSAKDSERFEKLLIEFGLANPHKEL